MRCWKDRWSAKWDERITKDEIEFRIAPLNTKTKAMFLATIELQGYNLNRLYDVLDVSGKWMNAKIIELDTIKMIAKVAYCGWGPYWDEWLPYPCYRFAEYNSKCRSRYTEMVLDFIVLIFYLGSFVSH